MRESPLVVKQADRNPDTFVGLARTYARLDTSRIDTIDTLLSRRDTYTLNWPRIDGSPRVDVFVVEPLRAALCNQRHHARKQKKKREITRESMAAHPRIVR